MKEEAEAANSHGWLGGALAPVIRSPHLNFRVVQIGNVRETILRPLRPSGLISPSKWKEGEPPFPQQSVGNLTSAHYLFTPSGAASLIIICPNSAVWGVLPLLLPSFHFIYSFSFHIQFSRTIKTQFTCPLPPSLDGPLKPPSSINITPPGQGGQAGSVSEITVAQMSASGFR
jgi:hypothetical protein